MEKSKLTIQKPDLKFKVKKFKRKREKHFNEGHVFKKLK